MNIGIIVYSQTGNTLRICEDIKKNLEQASHSVTIEQVGVAETHRHTPDAGLTASPDPGCYDAIILASPVQGFSLARPMQTYLRTQKNLAGRKTAIVLTKGLPFRWTGGNQALSAMNQLATEAGAELMPDGIIIRAGSDTSRASAAAAGRMLDFFKKL